MGSLLLPEPSRVFDTTNLAPQAKDARVIAKKGLAEAGFLYTILTSPATQQQAVVLARRLQSPNESIHDGTVEKLLANNTMAVGALFASDEEARANLYKLALQSHDFKEITLSSGQRFVVVTETGPSAQVEKKVIHDEPGPGITTTASTTLEPVEHSLLHEGRRVGLQVAARPIAETEAEPPYLPDWLRDLKRAQAANSNIEVMTQEYTQAIDIHLSKDEPLWEEISEKFRSLGRTDPETDKRLIEELGNPNSGFARIETARAGSGISFTSFGVVLRGDIVGLPRENQEIRRFAAEAARIIWGTQAQRDTILQERIIDCMYSHILDNASPRTTIYALPVHSEIDVYEQMPDWLKTDRKKSTEGSPDPIEPPKEGYTLEFRLPDTHRFPPPIEAFTDLDSEAALEARRVIFDEFLKSGFVRARVLGEDGSEVDVLMSQPRTHVPVVVDQTRDAIAQILDRLQFITPTDTDEFLQRYGLRYDQVADINIVPGETSKVLTIRKRERASKGLQAQYLRQLRQYAELPAQGPISSLLQVEVIAGNPSLERILSEGSAVLAGTDPEQVQNILRQNSNSLPFEHAQVRLKDDRTVECLVRELADGKDRTDDSLAFAGEIAANLDDAGVAFMDAYRAISVVTIENQTYLIFPMELYHG